MYSSPQVNAGIYKAYIILRICNLYRLTKYSLDSSSCRVLTERHGPVVNTPDWY
jgi:hypothetical protein